MVSTGTVKSSRSFALMVAVLVVLCSASAHAQSDLLGRHTVNLRLKPMPAADVLNVLSMRSKAVDSLGVRHAEGRPWDVDGAELLDGLVIAVHFVETPVEDQVARILGCLGFSYQENGDRIQIVKAARALSAGECESVKLVSPHASDNASLDRKLNNTWKLESISGMDFIKRYAHDTHNMVKVPDEYIAALAQIRLRVEISGMNDGEVVENFANCIGWTLQSSSEGFVFTKPETVNARTPCQGFTVL